MSTLEVNTIDSVSGTSTLTVGSSNSSAISLAKNVSLASGVEQSNFLNPAFCARMSGAQSITSGTYTKVDYDTEFFDTDSAYDHSTNQRFTVPSGKDGKYFFYAQALADAAGAAQLENTQMTFYKNGSVFKKNAWNFNSNDIYYAGMQISSVMDLSAGDYIEVYIRISDASGNPVIDGSDSTLSEFLGYRIGT